MAEDGDALRTYAWEHLLTSADYDLLRGLVGEEQTPVWLPNAVRRPDLVIAPRGEPYLFRWHLIPRNDRANVYLHIQVADDPERPLHDHQYDNQSVILAGGYEEHFAPAYWPAENRSRFAPDKPFLHPQRFRIVIKGDVVHRHATEAHRLKILDGVPYTMTIFSTGPRIREWGFWIDGSWVPWFDVTEGDYRAGGVSKWKDKQ